MFPALFWVALAVQDSYRQAMALYQQHRYREEAAAFESVVENDHSRDVALFLGQSCFLSRQYAKAIPWLKRAAANSARTVETNYMLGNAYLLAHQPEKAVGPFAAVFGINTDSAGAHIVAAEMMVRQNCSSMPNVKCTAAWN